MKRRRSDILAEEQVLLSKERTILSFMRTALALVGVGVIIVNVLKEIVFQAVGYGLIVVGFVELIESVRKLREKQKLMQVLERQAARRT